MTEPETPSGPRAAIRLAVEDLRLALDGDAPAAAPSPPRGAESAGVMDAPSPPRESPPATPLPAAPLGGSSTAGLPASSLQRAPGASVDAATADAASGAPTAELQDARPVTQRAPANRKRTKVRQVFIVSLARSGSTLLRYLLDSHPEIVSPAELNLSALLQHTAQVLTAANNALGASPGPDHPAELPPDVRRRARKAVDEIMVTAANGVGASVFCDKSLTTVDHLPIVSQCYPDASYVFLYRYPLDQIASGIEASRWGFQAYGFAPYVGSAPGNFVAGLGNYWIDRVSKMLEFERTCTVPHARLYYELLCDDPAKTLKDLLEFLDLPADDSIIERAFDDAHGRGPGDYKIGFTRSISADSIGRGSTLPRMLGATQITRIDELLAELDYPALESGWNGDLTTLLGLRTASHAEPDSASIGQSVVALLASRTDVWPAQGSTTSFDLVIVGRVGDDEIVTVDRERGVNLAAGPDAETSGRPRIRCVGDALLRVASGELPMAEAVHDGLIRFDNSNPDETAPVDPHAVLRCLHALVGVPSASR